MLPQTLWVAGALDYYGSCRYLLGLVCSQFLRLYEVLYLVNSLDSRVRSVRRVVCGALQPLDERKST